MADSREQDNTGLGVHQAARLEKLHKIEALGLDPWGQRFDERSFIRSVRELADQVKYRKEDGTLVELPDLEQLAAAGTPVDYKAWKGEQGPGEEIGPTVRVAGRILLLRSAGKLSFLNIRDWTGDIQILLAKGQVSDEDLDVIKLLDFGDLVGIDGRLGRTNTGELTVFATKLHFMTKTLEPPPEKHAGLQDPELRQRMRYVDLTYNPESLDRFTKRTKIIHSIRSTLAKHQFVEVEGPTLHTIAGGAAAKPFVTHHNALDMQLFLRIALELHLKRLLVGGIERVYEMGRVYRNEGISPKHNPEFTMIELYWAYANYETMMDLTQQIICEAIQATGQGYQLKWGDLDIDFTPPFQRRTYSDLFEEHTGLSFHDDAGIAKLAKKIGLQPDGKHPDVVKSEVFEEKVEDALIGPIFVIDYPASICPLTKRKTGKPEIAERFELFIHGMELANAYTELNDPILQEDLFRTQLDGMAEEDSMAKMDHDFVRALRHGMPPAGGLGIGIDRLIMLLTNAKSIRDVILFPLLRHES
ncbi:lysine--tRNA ligase [Pirellula sp. SH-Sr6A]|uniref:lysine--tRNA ligase n=1 Tax=Pirellula sp. SH-Sr6A TaxID=1632865 RepID=UPI0011BACCBB|nr:lysine--tRNA ligase [Pirellula sp. SH-Sr6A]